MQREGPLRAWDWLPAGFFAIHLLHPLLLAHWYPHHLYDPDLLAHFVYFRNWLTHDTSLFGIPYFTHPKPLLVFVQGPLANVELAFYCAAVASGLLGSLVYLVGRDCLSRTAGILFSLFLLLDPSKSVLTLKSGADMYIALLLFSTIYLCGRGRTGLAAVCLLASALIKPVTLPCVAALVAAQPHAKKAWAWALLPFLALPLTLWSNQALLGTALGSEHFFREFAALRDGSPIPTGDVLHFAFWTQLVKNRFMSTAPLGFVGLVVWLAADRSRLTSPLLLVPLLFAIGYFLLSLAAPYMPFFRFFWPLEIWFLGFLLFGILETARRLAGNKRWVRLAVGALLLFFLSDDFIIRQLRYRQEFALPFEQSMAFVSSAREILAQKPGAHERILAPLAFLPYLTWELTRQGGSDQIVVAEQVALDRVAIRPNWILDVPEIYASLSTGGVVAQLIKDGAYEVRLTDGKAALLSLPDTPYR
ncbi:MAG: hypothetical protein ABSA52_22755 [Candidatus Binatia bacterium]|jgi:hypothetical protein